MKAVRLHRPRHVSVDTVDDPKIEAPRDAIVRVTATSICGSDLHVYNGLLPQLRPMTLGHEMTGVVEEVGGEVHQLRRGDRVVVPFAVACGRCFFCERGLTPHCEASNPRHYGPDGGMLSEKGGGLLGFTDLYGGYEGAQAEFVRVPFADFGPRKIPETLSDEQAIFLGCSFAAGFSAAEWAQIKPGDTVAVFGCGAVGIMAQKAAWLKGAGRVIGIDREVYRMDRAREAAQAETIDAVEADPVVLLREMTGGRGPDVVIDAVGMEGHRGLLQKLSNAVHAQVGTCEVLKQAVRAVRRGGSLSVIGLYAMSYDGFPLGQIFDKGVRISIGQALVHRHIDELLRLASTAQVRLDDVVTHRTRLADAPRMYEIFNAKKDRCVKVVMRP